MAVRKPNPQSVAKPSAKATAYLQPTVKNNQRPLQNSHGPATNKMQNQGGTVPITNRIFADGAKFSQANAAYNTAKGSLGKGFVKNPNSKTGWSWVDEFGRMADSRPPQRNERQISLQQIQRLNPNFLRAQQPQQNTQAQAPQQAGPNAPWLVGFAGGNGWGQTVDGGWYHGDTGQYWKPGTPIPGAGAPAQPQMTGDQYTSLYANLLKMFEGL